MQVFPSHDPLLDVEPELRVRALVVSDDPLVRSGFVMRLDGGAAGEARGEDDVRDAIDRCEANLVLWDLGPAVGDTALGFDELDVPVVALAPAGGDAHHLLAQGAAGVLLRDAPAAALRSALLTVLRGLTVVDPSLYALSSDTPVSDPEHAESDALPLDPLTSREQEVLGLMAMGLSNKQIAKRLGISAHTAKFHIGAILAKLDARSRTEAVVRAVQQGLVML
jgi:DNA-binding NarL/FixJ family response regulator